MKLRTRLWLSPLILVLGGCGYNRIQQYDENAEQAKKQISVQLQRRADLVPNLVNTVKGYAQHEEAVFTQVATARGALTGAIQGGDPTQMAAANAQLTGALGRLIAVAEAYLHPDFPAGSHGQGDRSKGAHLLRGGPGI